MAMHITVMWQYKITVDTEVASRTVDRSEPAGAVAPRGALQTLRCLQVLHVSAVCARYGVGCTLWTEVSSRAPASVAL